MSNQWKGQGAFVPGIAVFSGYAGDNRRHSHWAHQVTVGLDDEVCFKTTEGELRGKVLWLPSGEAHQLVPGNILSVYIDPASEAARWLFEEAEVPGTLAENKINLLEQWVATHASPYEVLNHIQTEALSQRTSSDNRLSRVLAALREDLDSGVVRSREQLAAEFHLSPTRFSHWFREETGVPLRSYRKWMRLLDGMQKVIAGESSVDVAQEAGFSDQAHFSRTFSQAFGIRLADILHALQPQQD